MFQIIKKLFSRAQPERKTIIHFSANGCMCTDWVEVNRGTVIDQVSRNVYNGSGGQMCSYWIAERADGSTFSCYTGDTRPGTETMQQWTENPDESLVGKLVFIT